MTGKRTTEDQTQHTGQEAAGESGSAEEPVATGAGGGDETAPEPEPEPTAQQLQAELDELKDRHLRLAADFENFKKRARQDRADLLRYASAQLAEELLTVLDDFDRVLAHAPEGVDDAWLRGVRMTSERLGEVLGSVGVEHIESVGTRFDPKLHEAIATEETSEHPEDTVVAELRRGYRMHDRVLRPAMVRIARSPSNGA